MFDSDLPIDRNGKWPTDSPSVSILLRARPSDTLDWKQALERAALAGQGGKKIFWQLDLGLEAPEFLWEDEFLFQAAKLALENFTKEVWPVYQPRTVGLSFFAGRPVSNALCNYCQMLSASLPDELSATLLFQGSFSGAQKGELLSEFEYFQIWFQEGEGIVWNEERIEKKHLSKIAVCIPDEPPFGFDDLLQRLSFSFRLIPEKVLNERWSEVDILYVFSSYLTARGKRMLQGFCAAGGLVVVEGEPIGLENEIGAEGFEPPAYWSQTSRASQTALCPDQ